MGQPAAKQGDRITASDTHIVLVPSASGTVPTPLPGHVFSGALSANLSPNVKIEGQAAATVGSTATNSPAHLPMPPGTGFLVPPTNQGQISKGSATVFINRKPAARAGDTAITCNDPLPLPVGTVVAQSKVLIGG